MHPSCTWRAEQGTSVARSKARGYVGFRRRPAPNPRFRRSRRRPKRGQRGPRALGTPVECCPVRRGARERESRGRRHEGEHQMTRQRSFKRLVRARMEKTGESYTAARAALLSAAPTSRRRARRRRSRPRTRRSASAPAAAGRSGSTCSTSGARPSARTARSRAGSPSSRASIRWPGTRRRWSAATSAPAGCARVGEHADGFRDHRIEDRGGAGRAALRRVRRRVACASAGCPTASCASAPRRSRSRPASTGATAASRVHVTFAAKGADESTAALSHERLADAAERERMKAYWRERVTALKEELER